MYSTNISRETISCDGQVANRPVYAAIGVTVDGQLDILGLWVGTGGEGAKYWLQVLTEIQNRGVDDDCIVACDRLKGLPESIEVCGSSGSHEQAPLSSRLIRDAMRAAGATLPNPLDRLRSKTQKPQAS